MSFHDDQYERSSQPDESLAEIRRLKSELRIALVYLTHAKSIMRPWTTNSDVDNFLAKHAALLDDTPWLARDNTSWGKP
jgi:hypothetical protein